MRKFSTGITLLELMITVAVVGILAAIAYPSYQEQVRKSKRTEAKVELMTLAQTLEKCYTMKSTYIDCVGVTLPSTLASGTYKIDEGAGKVTASSFELAATPQGAQAKDKACALFTISNSAALQGFKDDTTENAACLK